MIPPGRSQGRRAVPGWLGVAPLPCYPIGAHGLVDVEVGGIDRTRSVAGDDKGQGIPDGRSS